MLLAFLESKGESLDRREGIDVVRDFVAVADHHLVACGYGRDPGAELKVSLIDDPCSFIALHGFPGHVPFEADDCISDRLARNIRHRDHEFGCKRKR